MRTIKLNEATFIRVGRNLLVSRILAWGGNKRRRPAPHAANPSSSRSHAKRVSLIVALNLWIMSFVGPAYAGPMIFIRIDEDGKGSFEVLTERGPTGKLEGKLERDDLNPNATGAGTLALTYTLPANLINVGDGDVLIEEPIVSGRADLLRFKNNKLIIYSATGEGVAMEEAKPPLADTPERLFPSTPRGQPKLSPNLREDGGEDDSGKVYIPGANAPGADKGAAGRETANIRYLFKSEGSGGPEVKKYDQPETKSGGRSVSYNSSQRRLSFSGDRITETIGFDDDAMLNADVNVPDFSLVGTLANGDFVFQSSTSGSFSVSSSSAIFMQAQLTALIYLVAANTFSGELTNASFDGSAGSLWIDNLAYLLDPQSPDFDPSRRLFFTYTPDNDFLALTRGFSVDGRSSGTNVIGAAVPGPSPFWLLATGLLAVGMWRLSRNGVQGGSHRAASTRTRSLVRYANAGRCGHGVSASG